MTPQRGRVGFLVKAESVFESMIYLYSISLRVYRRRADVLDGASEAEEEPSTSAIMGISDEVRDDLRDVIVELGKEAEMRPYHGLKTHAP